MRLPVFLLLLTLDVPSPAAATAFCPILKSPDGFVALRKGPGTTFPIVARMKEDDDVQAFEKKGPWIRIRHWWGMDRLDEKKRADHRDGWVNKRYLGECG
ncbi:MAG: SH3 domain-containing protein [Pseudolabrys sp.]